MVMIYTAANSDRYSLLMDIAWNSKWFDATPQINRRRKHKQSHCCRYLVLSPMSGEYANFFFQFPVQFSSRTNA